jgi:flagellar biosynthesis anti-sigma factor FlgM
MDELKRITQSTGVPMKITDSAQPQIVPKDPGVRKPEGGDQTPETVTAARPDSEAFSVQLTSRAGQLHESLKSDEVNLAKVAAIRDQLAAGTYSISGKDVANKILGALKG